MVDGQMADSPKPPSLKLTPAATTSPTLPGSPATTDKKPSQLQEDLNRSESALVQQWSETAGSPNSRENSQLPHPSPVYCIPTSTQGPEYFAGRHQDGVRTLLIVMVGLPARGKTFLAQKLCRLLGWHGHKAQVFNVQVIWKQKLREKLALNPQMPLIASAEVFQKLCEESSEVRALYQSVLESVAQEAKAFYEERGVVIILNDDFTTSSLRGDVERILSPTASQTVFVEVQRDSSRNRQFDQLKVMDPEEYPTTGIVATDEGVTASEMWVAASSDGAASSTSADSNNTATNRDLLLSASMANDFAERVRLLEATYETMLPTSGRSYIKMKNADVLEVHKVQGFLCGRIVSFLMSLSQFKVQHPIYFVRHGQSMYNLDDRIGGDPVLTEKGLTDAEALFQFVSSLKQEDDAATEGDPARCMQIWTSQLRRAVQTAEPSEQRLGIRCMRFSSLNEIHAGVCENMTYKEVASVYPLIHRFRGENKYSFRYPQGESYQDLVMRLEPVIMELENANRVVVVVAHQAVLRALLAYFGSTSAESSVYVEVPHRTVWRCTYNSKGIASVDALKLGDAAAGDGCKD